MEIFNNDGFLLRVIYDTDINSNDSLLLVDKRYLIKQLEDMYSLSHESAAVQSADFVPKPMVSRRKRQTMNRMNTRGKRNIGTVYMQLIVQIQVKFPRTCSNTACKARVIKKVQKQTLKVVQFEIKIRLDDGRVIVIGIVFVLITENTLTSTMTTITTKATTTTVATTAKTITTVVTTSATATATTPAVATTTGSGTTATESATATTESGTTETATTGSGTTETATTAGQMRQIMFANQTTFYSGSNNPASVAVGYFDNDNELDIVVANIGYINYIYHVAVFLGIGNGYFRSQTLFPTGSQPYSVAVGDFNNDNRSDIVVANYNGSSVSVLLGYGNGTFASQRIFPAGNGPRSIAVGDFNDDNQLDIVVANDGSMNGIFNVGLLLGYGNGTFASQITFSDGYRPYSVTVGDFNNDNRLDIAMANYFSDNVGVRLGYGNGTFAGQKTFTTGAGPWSVAVGDFNNDNRSDIAVANYNGFNVGVLTGDGDGAFPNQTTYSTGVSSFPNAIAVGDFNNDDRSDIVVANFVSHSMGILLNVS